MIAGGDGILLNGAVAPTGRIRVEVQNEQGRALPGYGVEDCVPFTGDEVAHAVAWTSGSRERIAGRPVRVQVELDRARLYTFRFG